MVNDTSISVVETLAHAALDERQQSWLFKRIKDLFSDAIDARSPKNRPPGKAGLRSEKGYFRLLYLEGEFQDAILSHGNDGSRTYDWQRISEIFGQLKDLPEVRSELSLGIEAALHELTEQ